MNTKTLALLCGSLLVAACSTPSEPAATLPMPSLTHASETAGSPPHSDPEAVEWSRSNALVGTLGGHAGHLRGAAAPASAPEGQP